MFGEICVWMYQGISHFTETNLKCLAGNNFKINWWADGKVLAIYAKGHGFKSRIGRYDYITEI